MSAVLNALRAGRERVARGWTQRAYARRPGTIAVRPHNPSAVCWCAIGAVRADRRTLSAHDPAVEALGEQLLSDGCAYGDDVAAFNDDPTTTQADVLALYDRAIAANGGAP